jgi:DNA primase
MSFLNFEEIKAANPISEVAERLGLNMNKSGASLRGKCPVCESGGDRNLVITPDKGVYYCFSQGKGGDALQLVAHVKGIGVKQAGEWLQGSPQQDNPSKGNRSKEKDKAEEPSQGFAPLAYLDPGHEAVVALGIEPGDADRIGCGFAPRGMMKGLVAVPIRLTDGRLIGYIGVTEAKLPGSWKF